MVGISWSLSASHCRLLPLYFPRDKREEEIANLKLPADVGDENGETVIDERKIRIKPLPKLKQNSPKVAEISSSTDLPISDTGLTRRLLMHNTFPTPFACIVTDHMQSQTRYNF